MTDKSLDQLLGDRLRSLREGRGLSLGELAEISGVSKAMIARVEKIAPVGVHSWHWKTPSVIRTVCRREEGGGAALPCDFAMRYDRNTPSELARG